MKAVNLFCFVFLNTNFTFNVILVAYGRTVKSCELKGNCVVYPETLRSRHVGMLLPLRSWGFYMNLNDS
jgi:hypothetical protein